MSKKQDVPRDIGLLLGVPERTDWYSKGAKVTAKFADDIGPLLGVPRLGLTKVNHMRAILESVGVRWDVSRHSSENAKSPGGNVRKEAYEDLFNALQEALEHKGSEASPAPLSAVAQEYVRRLIRLRRGQQSFRAALLRAYQGKCAITGTAVSEVLDAAHIKPFSQGGAQETTNGLLLRTDLHTLLDLGLISIDADNWTVLVHESLDGTEYEGLRGKPLGLPKSKASWPNKIAVNEHRAWSGL